MKCLLIAAFVLLLILAVSVFVGMPQLMREPTSARVGVDYQSAGSPNMDSKGAGDENKNSPLAPAHAIAQVHRPEHLLPIQTGKPNLLAATNHLPWAWMEGLSATQQSRVLVAFTEMAAELKKRCPPESVVTQSGKVRLEEIFFDAQSHLDRKLREVLDDTQFERYRESLPDALQTKLRERNLLKIN